MAILAAVIVSHALIITWNALQTVILIVHMLRRLLLTMFLFSYSCPCGGSLNAFFLQMSLNNSQCNCKNERYPYCCVMSLKSLDCCWVYSKIHHPTDSDWKWMVTEANWPASTKKKEVAERNIYKLWQGFWFMFMIWRLWIISSLAWWFVILSLINFFYRAITSQLGELAFSDHFLWRLWKPHEGVCSKCSGILLNGYNK